MLKSLLRKFMHIYFLFARPLTLGVRGVLYDSETKSVLLVKHTCFNEWALPGGGTELGESMLTSIEREVHEETGLTCKSLRMLDVYHNNTISKRDHIGIYLVEEWCEDLHAHSNSALEIAEACWFKLGEIPETITPCSKYALKICKLA